MALHGVDVTIFTDLERSYQSEQDPVEVRPSVCLCVRVCASVYVVIK